ncbi:YbhB/YbcL family Raf kinase inhibitor-like protein [Patescibacteria group bacterium]
MQISCPGFANEERIPIKHTCDNSDVNPTLNISEVPDNTKSLALIVDDSDAPMGTWIHWLVWNIDPKISSVDENTIPKDALQGKNDFGKLNWGGPCPSDGEHHYSFKLFALDTKLDLHEGSTIKDLENVMLGHILEKAELVGIYSRQ